MSETFAAASGATKPPVNNPRVDEEAPLTDPPLAAVKSPNLVSSPDVDKVIKSIVISGSTSGSAVLPPPKTPLVDDAKLPP